MMTLPTAFATKAESGFLDLVHYVKVELHSGQIFEASTREWGGLPSSIASVSPANFILDPLDRKSKVDTFKVTSAGDGFLYQFITENNCKGAEVTVLVGDMSASSSSDLGPKFKGTCDVALPNSKLATATLTCKNYLDPVLDNQIVGRWLNMHLLEIIEQILTTDTADGGLGIDSAIIDLTSLDPDTWPDIKHYVVSRGTISDIYKDTSVSSPVSAKQLIDELAMLMDGQLMCLEDGKIRFHRFAAGTAPVDNWTNDDILDITLEDLDSNARNRITLEFNQLAETSALSPRGEDITPKAMVYRQMNEDAANDVKSPHQTARIIDENYSTPWVEGDANIIENAVYQNGEEGYNPEGIPASLGAGDEFFLGGGMFHAFCGTRTPGFAPGLGQYEPTWKLDADHLAYIQVGDEIISIDKLVVDGRSVAHVYDSPATTIQNAIGALATSLPNLGTFRIAERGCFGTPVQDHAGTQNNQDTYGSSLVNIAHDVTIPVNFVNAKLARFARGAPKITVKTQHHKYGCQVGDIITLTTDWVKYLSRTLGLDTTDKWEIVGKSDDVYGGKDPCITWTLVWAYSGTGAEPITDDYNTRIGRRDQSTKHQQTIDDGSNENVRQPRMDGGIITHSGTFTIDSDKSVFSGAGGARRLPTRTIPVEEDMDTHVFIDNRTGAIQTIATGHGAPAPATPPNNTRIATVVTDGVDVQTIKDERNTNAPVANDAVTTLAQRGIQSNRTFSKLSRG